MRTAPLRMAATTVAAVFTVAATPAHVVTLLSRVVEIAVAED